MKAILFSLAMFIGISVQAQFIFKASMTHSRTGLYTNKTTRVFGYFVFDDRVTFIQANAKTKKYTVTEYDNDSGLIHGPRWPRRSISFIQFKSGELNGFRAKGYANPIDGVPRSMVISGSEMTNITSSAWQLDEFKGRLIPDKTTTAEVSAMDYATAVLHCEGKLLARGYLKE
jgi:hypothetical protein